MICSSFLINNYNKKKKTLHSSWTFGENQGFRRTKIRFRRAETDLCVLRRRSSRTTWAGPGSCVLPSVLPFPAYSAWIWAISWANLVICATRMKKNAQPRRKKEKMTEASCGNLVLNSRKILSFIPGWPRPTKDTRSCWISGILVHRFNRDQ